MRLLNRVLAALVAGAVAVFSAIIAVEIVLGYYFGRDPWLLPWDRWYRRSRELVWSDRSVVLAFALIGLAGLVLLAVQLWRRAPVALPLQDATPGVHAEIHRRSLEHAVTRAALSVDGVATARVRSRRRRLSVHAETQLRQPGDLRDRVNAAATSVLTGLRLQEPPRLTVGVDSRRAVRGDV